MKGQKSWVPYDVQAIEIRLSKRDFVAEQGDRQCRAQQRPYGNEDQRVGELAVVLQKEQRVVRRADQDIDVWRHSGEGTEQPGAACPLSLRDRLYDRRP